MTAINREHRIALFLDFENLVTNTGITPSSFDLQPALDRLLEKGKVVFRRAYCDWSRFREAKGRLHELGVELIDVPPSTRAGKNGADMRLVIDALKLCYAREHIDTFVIASGDSDFCPLAYKLRENDRSVIGLAVREATSPFFMKACDEFIYLRPTASGAGDEAVAAKPGRRIGRGRTRKPKVEAASADAAVTSEGEATVSLEGAEPSEPAKRSRRGRTRKPAAETKATTQAAQALETENVEPEQAAKAEPAPAGGRGRGRGRLPKPEIPAIAREVVASLLAQATGPVNPSRIKETIVRKEPDFSEREHGFSTFSKLLAAMEREGMLRRQQTGTQWYVVPPDAPLAAPEPVDGNRALPVPPA